MGAIPILCEDLAMFMLLAYSLLRSFEQFIGTTKIDSGLTVILRFDLRFLFQSAEVEIIIFSSASLSALQNFFSVLFGYCALQLMKTP